MNQDTYQTYFTKVQRLTGSRRLVKILQSDKVIQFIQAVAGDKDLKQSIRLIACIAAGSGARISEILDIRKRDIAGGFFSYRVTKKDMEQCRRDKKRKLEGKPPLPWNPVIRKCKIPGAVLGELGELLKHRKPLERLFKLDRYQALRGIKAAFGEDTECHGFRHGFISWLMDSGQVEQAVADAVKIDRKTVRTYSHITDLEEFYNKLGL